MLKNIKAIWITQSIIVAITICLSILSIGIKENPSYYIIINAISSFIIIVYLNLIARYFNQHLSFNLISIVSFLISLIFPFATFLPLICLTISNSEKKITNIIKGRFIAVCIISVIVSMISSIIVGTMVIGATSADIFYLNCITVALYVIFNTPLLTLYGLLLGYKKLKSYYLLLIPFGLCCLLCCLILLLYLIMILLALLGM